MSETQPDLSSVLMGRMVIESTGRIGSLYDGRRDCLLEQLEINTNEISSTIKNSVSCELENGDTEKSGNLLQMIGIEADLRLNILLSSAERTGMATLVDYPCPINKNTRFLHYTYINRMEQLCDIPTQPTNSLASLNRESNATHIITGLSWGINIVVGLQLPSEVETVTAIDNILKRVRAFLKGNQNNEKFSPNDEELLNKVVNIDIYSNIPNLRSINSVLNICQYINGHSEQLNSYHPFQYFLKPIKYLYPQYNNPNDNFAPLPSTLVDKLEQHLIQLLETTKTLKYSLDFIITNLLNGQFEEQLNKAKQQWSNLVDTYKNHTKQVRCMVNRIRCGRADTMEIDQAFVDPTRTTLNSCIDTLTQNLDNLRVKGQLISDLRGYCFEYYNVAELNVTNKEYEQILLQKLITDKRKTRLLCSNDMLNKKNQSKFNELRDQLIQEYKTNQELRLIYADFSYCSFELTDMTILPSRKMSTNTDTYNQSTSVSKNDSIINVLLLGESGVGKSTFINAFVNYLTFKTFQQAASNKPVALIPVSFFLTTGNNFEDRTIKFGNVDHLHNEDFDHPGQSVTQHCKSYLFTLNHSDNKKLRIIDTPGFGDTRGLNQDEFNMQHILEYINNLPHLNAICFLLKANATQLNKYFLVCLIQLLDLLGSNACQNIIFGFTSARPTFYTPGDTASLLRTLLNSSSINGISFNKQNVFCFDNESFRYLVALQNGIQFNDDDKKQYEMSWSTSVNESNRLVSYITTQLRVYSLHTERQSIKHAQIQITYLIRPMLEAMRNILRNIILSNTKYPNKTIELRPHAIHRFASKCLSCNIHPIQFGDLFIASDDPHEIYNHCYHCSCIASQHISIDYILNYELLDRSTKYNRNQMDDMIRQLRQASNEFAQFLMHIARSTKNDPFSKGLIRMIKQESDLCQRLKPNTLNSQMIENLKKLQHTYEQAVNQTVQNQKYAKLPLIYEMIQTIHTHPEVYKQMNAINEGQQILLKEYEYQVPEVLKK